MNTDSPLDDEPNGSRSRIIGEGDDPFAGYDPRRVEAAFKRVFGLLADIDHEALVAELREQREQDSLGRPA